MKSFENVFWFIYKLKDLVKAGMSPSTAFRREIPIFFIKNINFNPKFLPLKVPSILKISNTA